MSFIHYPQILVKKNVSLRGGATKQPACGRQVCQITSNAFCQIKMYYKINKRFQ